MQHTSVKLEQYARAKGSEAQYLRKEMQKLQEMFDKQSKQLDLTTEQYAECKKKLSSVKIKNLKKKLKRRDQMTVKIATLEN